MIPIGRICLLLHALMTIRRNIKGIYDTHCWRFTYLWSHFSMRYGVILRVSMMPIGKIYLLSHIDMRYCYARLSGVILRVSMIPIGRICLFILAMPWWLSAVIPAITGLVLPKPGISYANLAVSFWWVCGIFKRSFSRCSLDCLFGSFLFFLFG